MVINMSNLIEIQSQIEKLQKQATEIKAREFHKTVQDILAKMQAFGITLKDLQPGKARVGKAKGKIAKGVKSAPKAVKRTEKSGPAVAAKYRGPNGETWSGRGLTPRWLAALIAQGKTKEEFTIQS
jgi:DNA-binding protein H-NS